MDSSCAQNANGETVGLLMTYRCNLACKYCYIHHKQNKDMTLEMACSILEPFLLDDHSGWLDIMLVGGETLMAIDVIKPLVEWAEGLCPKRDFRFFGSTNGTLLTDGLKNWFSEHSQTIILALSYDGLPSAQMDNRGSDSIDVDFFIRTWPRQPIQMTINERSVRSMADGVVYLLEKGAVVHPNVAYEEKQWSDESVAEYAAQLNRLIDYYDSHDGLPQISQFRHDLKEYVDNLDNPRPQTQMCGAGHGYQVFDVDGKSYPCFMLSPLVLKGNKLRQIQSGRFSQIDSFADSKCDDCPFRSACPTCLASNYIYRDDFSRRDNTHCRLMQIEVQAYLKKEVMRLSAKETLTPSDATEIDMICLLSAFLNHEAIR